MTDTTIIPTKRRAPKRATDLAQYTHTRVGNGSELLPGVDKRSIWVRRAKELIADYSRDLGSNISADERNLIRRVSVMTVELEQLEVKFAAASDGDLDDVASKALNSERDLYVRIAGAQRRLLADLQRRAKTVTVSDDPYIELEEAARKRETEEA